MMRFQGVYLRSGSATASVAALLLALSTVLSADTGRIRSVKVTKPFFNPTVGQTIGIELDVGSPGALSILVLDRDGYPVRRLVSAQAIQTGRVGFEWNGRDDHGEIVPDEAYSLRVDLVGDGWTSTYFPASEPAAAVTAEIKGYNRRSGVLSYKLSAPARVHAQAGVASPNEKTQKPEGPVMKTLANREPRPAGAVIENWDGFDETGATYLPDLPHFAVAVAASGLPENAMIAVGNDSVSFVGSVAKRSDVSLLPSPKSDHGHHKGLSTLDDVSPTLHAAPANARWSEESKSWAVEAPRLSGSISLEGPSAAQFARQPGQLEIYVDAKPIETIRSPEDGAPFSVPLQGLPAGAHVVAFNWSSDYGPVAVTSLRVERVAPGVASRTDSASRRAQP